MKMTLRNSVEGVKQMRQLWVKMKESLDSGVALVVQVDKETRTQDQNALYHSIINQIAKQARHLGSTWDAESWKRLLVDAYTREIGQSSGQVIPNLTGDGIVQLGLQTRKFTKQQASEFSEWLMAWAAQNGVTINEG
tara:strand:+ start:581 stop:991 length:411 start_codon:yes stop_codon:yes gene_type:complete